MTTANFQNLIRLVTGRDFSIKTEDIELQFEKEYVIYRILPVTKHSISFTWKTPKSDEKMLRSFITSFTSKYREPNPAAYITCSPYFSPSWSEMTAENQEFAYCHHASNMFSKDQLMKQVEDNFGKDSIANGLIRYGFYPTEYGVGIFCFWMTNGVISAIDAMKRYLNSINIPFTNEFSDARWVFRFRLEISKPVHTNILEQFN